MTRVVKRNRTRSSSGSWSQLGATVTEHVLEQNEFNNLKPAKVEPTSICLCLLLHCILTPIIIITIITNYIVLAYPPTNAKAHLLIMDRYPHSIVWTPLPFITWFIPIIGHTGIADSEGIIHDFGGSYYIAVDHMTFGRPTKFLKLDPVKTQALSWDDAIQVSADRFRQRTHNILTNNCHNHVADTLNEMKYNGKSNYNQFDIFLMMTMNSEYVDLKGFLYQWGFFIFLLVLVTVLVSIA